MVDISVNDLIKANLRHFWVMNFSKDSNVSIARKEMAKRVTESWNNLTANHVDSGLRKTRLLIQPKELIEIEGQQI